MSLFAGTQDIRYYLNGVCLQNNAEGLYAVATNGYVLSYAKLGDKLEGEDFEIILPNSAAKIIASCKERFGLDLEYERDTKQVSIKTQEGTQTLKAIEGKYPDWRRVVPLSRQKLEEDQRLGMSTKYLAYLDKAYKAFKKHSEGMLEGCEMEYYGYSSAMIFRPEGVKDITVLIMPRRV